MDVTPDETARSLYVVYRQLPAAAQRAFRALLEPAPPAPESQSEYQLAEWLPLAEPSLTNLWNAPEETYWDELYARQPPNRPPDAG